MRKIAKDKKGITLVALIITVVITLILLSVSIYSGLDAYNNSKVSKFVNQMQLLQAKIDDLSQTRTNNLSSTEIEEFIEELPEATSWSSIISDAYERGEISGNDASNFKFISQDNIQNFLETDNIKDDILVNFDTREIVSITGIEYEGTTYYTQYLLPGGQKLTQGNSEQTRTLSFNINTAYDGLNCLVTINNISITNGTLMYGEVIDNNVSNWVNIINYTETGKSYSVNISKSSTYKFRLKDNVDDSMSEPTQVNILTTNKPKTDYVLTYDYSSASENWAYVNGYVWIPRFAYKNNVIKFIKGNSNIATDNTYINTEWTIPSKFSLNDGSEITGLWVKVNNTSGLDIRTTLENATDTMEII